MSNFTPGPWTLSLHSGRSFNGASVIDAKGLTVASIPRAADRPYDRKEADGRLIAAAPDLLAAVRHLFVCDVAGSSVDFRCEGCEAARSALATVDGLAPARGSAPS